MSDGKAQTASTRDVSPLNRLDAIARRLVERLISVPGVVAVTLGGSRARGAAGPASDWDFGLYYRGGIDVPAVRALGYPGHVVAPGAWGRLVNGGAWLDVEGRRVDLLYRDLDVVEHWVAEAQAGRFEVDNVAGHVIGLPTYVLAGELALGVVLHGELPRPSFPEVLRRTAPPWWSGNAAFSLLFASGYAARQEPVACAGSLARAVMAAAHGRLAERGEWILNEKGLVRRAGLDEANGVLTGLGGRTEELAGSVEMLRHILGLGAPSSLELDEVTQPS